MFRRGKQRKREDESPRNRVFDNDERPLYEFELEEGHGFLIKDAQLLHYVSDVQLALGSRKGHRDIMIVRFQPLGR